MFGKFKDRMIGFIYSKPFERESGDLNTGFCSWIVPRLKLLRKYNMSYPAALYEDLGDEKGYIEWCKILNEMIEGFEAYLKKPYEESKEDKIKVHKALKLFNEYFEHLWW